MIPSPSLDFLKGRLKKIKKPGIGFACKNAGIPLGNSLPIQAKPMGCFVFLFQTVLTSHKYPVSSEESMIPSPRLDFLKKKLNKN